MRRATDMELQALLPVVVPKRGRIRSPHGLCGWANAETLAETAEFGACTQEAPGYAWAPG